MVQASHFKAQVDEEITHWWLSMSHIVFWIHLAEARNLIPVNLNHLKSCKIYSWRPLGIIMDDHDQPMSFLDPLYRYLQGLGVRPPFIACCSSCKGNGAWMGSCFTGWHLQKSLPVLSQVLACVVTGAAEILSPSSCGKAFQTQMHLEPCHEGRQTKPFVQNAKAARLQTFSFNLSSCPPAYGCPSTRHSSNVLLWKTSHDLQNGLCLLIALAGKADSAQCRAVFCGQLGTFSPYAKAVAQPFLVQQLSPANLTSSIVCCSAVLSCAASLQQTLSKAGHLMGASHCVLRMLSWLHLMSLRWARGQKQKTVEVYRWQ